MRALQGSVVLRRARLNLSSDIVISVKLEIVSGEIWQAGFERGRRANDPQTLRVRGR